MENARRQIVLVAAPLKSASNKLKDGTFVLKVITRDALEYLLSGAGVLLCSEQALSFNDSRELVCVSDEPFRFCQSIIEFNGVPFNYVTGVRLTKTHNQNFSFLNCYFGNSGLLGVRQIIYNNNHPVDTLNYYRAD